MVCVYIVTHHCIRDVLPNVADEMPTYTLVNRGLLLLNIGSPTEKRHKKHAESSATGFPTVGVVLCMRGLGR